MLKKKSPTNNIFIVCEERLWKTAHTPPSRFDVTASSNLLSSNKSRNFQLPKICLISYVWQNISVQKQDCFPTLTQSSLTLSVKVFCSHAGWRQRRICISDELKSIRVFKTAWYKQITHLWLNSPRLALQTIDRFVTVRQQTRESQMYCS